MPPGLVAALTLICLAGCSRDRSADGPWLALQTIADGRDRGEAVAPNGQAWLRNQDWAQSLGKCRPFSSQDLSDVFVTACCPGGLIVRASFNRPTIGSRSGYALGIVEEFRGQMETAANFNFDPETHSGPEPTTPAFENAYRAFFSKNCPP